MRKIAREVAFAIIYQSIFNKNDEYISSFDFLLQEKEILGEKKLDIEDEMYVKQIICLYEANREQIQTLVNNNIYGYEPERVYKIDMALLLLAVTEIYHYKTPKEIVINEILEIAKKYSTDKSAKFINGVLASIIKENLI